MTGALSSLTQYRDNLEDTAAASGGGGGGGGDMYARNAKFDGDILTPKGDIHKGGGRERLSSQTFDRENDDADLSDGSSAGSLGEWEEAERQVMMDEEIQHQTGNGTGQWISDGARPASLPWAQKQGVIETVKAVVPAKGIVPVKVASKGGFGAEGPVGPPQCNEKCITTEAGDAWNKFESAKVTQFCVALLTVLALFGDDIRVLFIAKAADDG